MGGMEQAGGTVVAGPSDRELVDGAVDLYVHSSPDLIPRRGNDLDLAKELATAGYSTALHRHHFSPTVDRSLLVSELTGFDLRGGLLMDDTAGGLHPAVAELALRTGGRWIGLPTISARYFRSRLSGMAPHVRDMLGIGGVVDVVDADGALLPELREVLALVAEHDAILATGYVSPVETFAVIEAAKDAGVERVVLSNPLSGAMGMSTDAVVEAMAATGIFLEISAYQYHDSAPRGPGALSLLDCGAVIRHVGVSRVILSSDGGMADAPPPQTLLADGMRAFMASGLTRSEVDRLVKENPTQLLER